MTQSRSWKLGERGHDSYWRRAWLDAQTKYKKSKKGISCDEKRKDAEVRERGEKKVNPGKHQAAIDVLISQGGFESGLGEVQAGPGVEQSYLDVNGHVCIVVQDASDVLATVVCISVCVWSASSSALVAG